MVVIDADDIQCKALFKRVIFDDIFEHNPEKLVSATSKQLESLGYKTQVFPREINFFYLKGAIRARIERQGEHFQLLDTEISFSEEEMRNEIESHPED